MDFFFQRHFCHRKKRAKPPAAACQASKARRRSSVGLPSAALVQSRRSSVGLPPVVTDQRRRTSAGLLLASGQRRQRGLTYISEGGSQYKASGSAPCVHRGMAMRPQRPQVRSIEPQLLRSSMLLASVVQMGRRAAGKKEEQEEVDAPCCSCSGSDGEEGNDEDVETTSVGFRLHMHLTQAVNVENIKPRPLISPPRCLRRNSSHLLPANSVFGKSETGYGVYGRYNRRKSSQVQQSLNKQIQSARTSPSLGQLDSARLVSENHESSSGSTLRKSCSSPLGETEETMYYDPYLDTWENFLSKAIAKSGLHHLPCQPGTSSLNRSDPEADIRSTLDWTESAVYGDHIWFETNVSGDYCYVGEEHCIARALQKSVSRRKCAACKIVAHTICIEQLDKFPSSRAILLDDRLPLKEPHFRVRHTTSLLACDTHTYTQCSGGS